MDEGERRNATRKVLSGRDVEVWRLSRGLDYGSMGRMLGVTAQSVKKYESSGMSRKDALALAAIDEGLEPYKPTEEDIQLAEEAKK
jgi:hypothetical protein